MSLGKKTISLFLVLGICLWVGSYAVLRTAVLPAFEQFERESTERALQRVTRMLDEDLRALEILNKEYSLWDDTYKFARGEIPQYADENLDPAYWHSINVNLLAIFDANGEELYSWISDPSDGSELPLRDELPFALEPGHPLIHHGDLSDSMRGVLNMQSGLMQVVSYPILTSDGKGPMAGSLIVGQSLDARRLHNLRQRATIDLSLLPIDGADVPAGVVEWLPGAPADEEFMHIETDGEVVNGYTALVDMFGAPLAVIEVSAPRRISQIGARTVKTAMVALAIASAVFLVTALLSLQKMIAMPIRKLTRQILAMRETGDLSVDVGQSRSDEVGTLASEFGLLAHRLQRAQEDSEAARDEAMAMSKAKSEFLARMSHEIRTPMNGVLGMTELLRETNLDDRQQQFTGTIYESAESLLRIINDILDISKIEAGKIELDVAPFNLQNLVEECLDLLAESAHRKRLELACSIPGDANVHVRGDPVRLRQILLNLVGNALKFTEHGEVVVRVTTPTLGFDRPNFRFEIQDTGIGISPDKVQDIFEPFVQEDGSNTRRFGGTGLGLAISKQLVELMGGEIGLNSVLGEGTTTWFTLELEQDQVSAANLQPHLLAGKSVLVVDDNETNRDILKHRLESWDMQVRTACSGADALSILRSAGLDQSPVDIMLLDMAMPGMDGLQLAHAIRSEDQYRAVPIVMLSSISRANIEEDQVANGPDEWLAKPVRQSRLYDALVSLLGKSFDHRKMARGSSQQAGDIPTKSHNGLNVLLVDDNEVNLAVAEAMLDSLGCRSTRATNGQLAVAACERQSYDVVLMDCRMPEMDGFEATRTIRNLEQKLGWKTTPIIALTAHALQGDRERCLAAGMNDYLSKPFTREQLKSVLVANAATDSSPPANHEEQQIEKTPATDTACANGAKGRILVADDNDVNQQVTRAMLQSLGYETESAADGEQALAALARERFDMVLMDCHMPLCNGYDATQEIRAREGESPPGGRIPVVAVTADVLESNRQKCLDVGMDDYLTKPFSQDKLRVVLNRWLRNGPSKESASVTIDADGFTRLGDTQTLASVDVAALNEIRQLDSSQGAVVLREIVVSYCASSTTLMLQLRAAAAEGDMGLVEHLAHSLKGGSSQLGAVLLSILCDEMIASAKDNDQKTLLIQVQRAAVEHAAVLAGLDRELQTIAA